MSFGREAIGLLLASTLLSACAERTHQAQTEEELKDELLILADIATPAAPNPNWPRATVYSNCISRTINAAPQHNRFGTLDLKQIHAKLRELPDQDQEEDLSPRTLGFQYVDRVLGFRTRSDSCAADSILKANRVQFVGDHAIAAIGWFSPCGFSHELIKFRKRGKAWTRISSESIMSKSLYDCDTGDRVPRADAFTVYRLDEPGSAAGAPAPRIRPPGPRSMGEDYRIIATAALQLTGDSAPKLCLRRSVDATSRESLSDAFRREPREHPAIAENYYEVAGRLGQDWETELLGPIRIDPGRFIAENRGLKIKAGCRSFPEIVAERPQVHGRYALIDIGTSWCSHSRNRFLLEKKASGWEMIARRHYPGISPFVCPPMPKLRSAEYLTIEGEGARIRPAPPQPPPPPMPPSRPGGV